MLTLVELPAFTEWFEKLRDRVARKQIAKRLARVQTAHLGDWKNLGGGLAELRVSSGPGYRLYVSQRGQTMLLLLCAGDKDSQQRDIIQARSHLADWLQEFGDETQDI